jgi:hypothetical protein
MKRAVILILSIPALVLLTSCEKEDYCWKCNHETFFANGYTSIIVDVCGMDYDERAAYEKANTNVFGSVKTVTNCKMAQ